MPEHLGGLGVVALDGWGRSWELGSVGSLVLKMGEWRFEPSKIQRICGVDLGSLLWRTFEPDQNVFL